MMRKVVVVLALAALWVSGCPKPERVAYTTAVGSQAFLVSIQKAHPECNATKTALCDKIARAAYAQNLLIDAGKIYCGSMEYLNGGPCHPPDKKTPAYQVAVDKLNAAIRAYEQAETDLRGAVK
jgi:hypothetical protein